MKLPQPYVVRRASRTSLSMPSSVNQSQEPTLLAELSSTLGHRSGMDFLTVGEICGNGAQSCKSRLHHHLISTVAGFD